MRAALSSRTYPLILNGGTEGRVAAYDLAVKRISMSTFPILLVAAS